MGLVGATVTGFAVGDDDGPTVGLEVGTALGLAVGVNVHIFNELISKTSTISHKPYLTTKLNKYSHSHERGSDDM